MPADGDWNKIFPALGFKDKKSFAKAQLPGGLTLADGSKIKGQLAENRRRIAKRAFKKSFVDYHNTLDFGSSNATFENGLLRIQIPLREEVKPRQITIK